MPSVTREADTAGGEVIRDHRRQWGECLYVYPVVSRRAKGLSIGVNLNPDKRCTFACLYCQIDRSASRGLDKVDLPTLRRELELALGQAATGRIWHEPRFAATPADMRRLNDIAFSGDGEPTCLPNFDQAVALAAQVNAEMGLDDVKLVVITNASRLDSPQVRRSLPILDAHNGEIWAKLDAGTEEYFRRVNRPHPMVLLDEIVAGITGVARGRAVVIQTLLFALDGAPPPPEEVHAYCKRLRQILDGGGQIRLVQVHTIARNPAEATASPLADRDLDALAATIRQSIAPVPVETFYGAAAPDKENLRSQNATSKERTER
jgi:wyosine [tRNA(Phe)-imidazoG37] synthetase (radical SAM superfamily)